MIARDKEVYAVGLSSNDSISDCAYIRRLNHIVSASSHFSLRDTSSRDLLISLGAPESKLTLCDDLAYAFCGGIASHDSQENPTPSDELTVGYVPLFLGPDTGRAMRDVEAIVRATKRLNPRRKVSIKLVPFYNENNFDVNLLNSVALSCANEEIAVKVAPFVSELSESPLLGLDACVSYKYHAALICACKGIPCLMVADANHPHYKKKMSYLASSSGNSALVFSDNLALDPEKVIFEFLSDLRHPMVDEATYSRSDTYLRKICANVFENHPSSN